MIQSHIRVALRADTSELIGRGHVARALALGVALKKLGADVRLVTRRLTSHTADLGAIFGIRCLWLPHPGSSTSITNADVPHAIWAGVGWEQDAEQVIRALGRWKPHWVIVDHYSFDRRWHRYVRLALDARIAVIDDLADRQLNADILIDHNLHANHRKKYAGKIGNAVKMLGGARYALLGPAYRKRRPFVVREKVRSVGIFLGGSDLENLSSMAIKMLREDVKFKGAIEAATTSLNPNLEDLARLAKECSARVRQDLTDLAGFFQRHDLQIGAGGGATWERSCIGVPSVVLQTADNQSQVLAGLQAHHAAVIVGRTRGGPQRRLAQAVRKLLENRIRRELLCARSRELVDGRGAERVALWFMSPALWVREGTLRDARLIYQWRNHPSTRLKSSDSREIRWNEHRHWLNRHLKEGGHYLLIGMVGSTSVGVARLDEVSDAVLEVSIYLDPALHGVGLGTRLLASAEKFLTERKGRKVQFVAKVIAGNRVSRALFAAAGYKYERGFWRKAGLGVRAHRPLGVQQCR